MSEAVSVPRELWRKCLETLQDELPLQQFNTWLRPLKVMADQDELCLLAPNRFILDWVRDKYLSRIEEILVDLSSGHPPAIALGVSNRRPSFGIRYPGANRLLDQGSATTGSEPPPGGSATQDAQPPSQKLTNPLRSRVPAVEPDDVEVPAATRQDASATRANTTAAPTGDSPPSSPHENTPPDDEEYPTYDTDTDVSPQPQASRRGLPLLHTRNSKQAAEKEEKPEKEIKHTCNLNSSFLFENFVEGKSNQLALAAAQQVVDNPGSAYNPLFLYGGVGLGKTHLMQAVGNELIRRSGNANIVYLHSERFVADMVKALQLNAINDFKLYYRSVDALLIDDIQFFAGKERSQEEFFHTFNALLEGGQQIILTCDRYPKEIGGLEERLKSRFGWGLTVAVDPPELETRVAILMSKAEQSGVELPHESAFFIAQRIRSNVRELEGALKRVTASAFFTGRKIDVDLIRESLKDLLALQERQVSIDNIQRIVAEYYKIRIADILSKRRSRSVARPRQIAMALSKELTSHSLPEIGEAYGGRDHTTVLHACRKVRQLCKADDEIAEDHKNLLQLLTN